MTLYRWISQLGRWLAEPWKVWIALAATVGVPVVAFISPISTSDQLRYSGLAFELLGIGTVWAGLRDRRILFGKQSTFDKTTGWLKRFPRLGPQTHTLVAAAGSMGIASAQGRMRAWHETSPTSSIDDRVAALEANIQTLRTEQGNLEQRLQQETRERQDADKAERERRESNYKEIQTTLDSLGAGNLGLETLGLLWLSLGVILSTLSSGSAP